MTHEKGLKVEINEDLKDRMIEHRNRFVRIFTARYREMLPSLILYRGKQNPGIDFLKVENALRNGYEVVIGQTTKGNINVIGYVKDGNSRENPATFEMLPRLTRENIIPIIDPELIPKEFKEISYEDNCKTGEFVVLRNKTLNYVNDMEVLEHYTSELAEIVLSRYSIAIQAKINTIFKGEINDQSINDIVSDLYNGVPYIKVSKYFDVEEQIIRLENQGMAGNFQELKREYQNKISELNNAQGINSLAVEKSSGVSDAEARGNRAFTTSNANIYLDARNNPLKKLNKRFKGIDIEAIYNDEVASEFQRLAKQEMGNTDEANNNDTGHSSSGTN